MGQNDRRWISGFWRRIGALLLDSAVLGIAGLGLGLVLEEQFVELGGWGRLVGFSVALLYFGVCNSNVAGGQTFGKRLLKIRVVDAENQPVGLPRSFLRFVILGAPIFLNGAQFSNSVMTSILLYPLSIIVFGGALRSAGISAFASCW